MKLEKYVIKKPSPRWIAKYQSMLRRDNPIRAIQALVDGAPALTPAQVSTLRALKLL